MIRLQLPSSFRLLAIFHLLIFLQSRSALSISSRSSIFIYNHTNLGLLLLPACFFSKNKCDIEVANFIWLIQSLENVKIASQNFYLYSQTNDKPFHLSIPSNSLLHKFMNQSRDSFCLIWFLTSKIRRMCAVAINHNCCTSLWSQFEGVLQRIYGYQRWDAKRFLFSSQSFYLLRNGHTKLEPQGWNADDDDAAFFRFHPSMDLP